jgi:hypothetical protein
MKISVSLWMFVFAAKRDVEQAKLFDFALNGVARKIQENTR